jgi:hypothetical protein
LTLKLHLGVTRDIVRKFFFFQHLLLTFLLLLALSPFPPLQSLLMEIENEKGTDQRRSRTISWASMAVYMNLSTLLLRIRKISPREQ